MSGFIKPEFPSEYHFLLLADVQASMSSAVYALVINEAISSDQEADDIKLYGADIIKDHGDVIGNRRGPITWNDFRLILASTMRRLLKKLEDANDGTI